MWHLEAPLRTAASLAARGNVSRLASRLRANFWSDQRRVVLRRDLSRALDPLSSPIGFSIRRLRARDLATIFDPDSIEEQAERAKRERWLRAGLRSCYVAESRGGHPVFLQWLCTSSDNEALRAVFPFENLAVEPGTILLEGAYTPPRFRHLPIMPSAMARIAERGREFGARWALVCVDVQSVSMLKAASWAGFSPWRLKIIHRRMFFPIYRYAAPPTSPAPARAPSAHSTRRAPKGRRRA